MNKRRYVSNRSLIFLSVTLLILGGLLFLNFFLLYGNAKSNLIAMKENEVLQAAKEYGNFFVESTYTVKAVAYSLDSMLTEQVSQEEILEYLQRQSKIYEKLVDKESMGLYGLIGGEFMDGKGWEPYEGFIAQERPWYETAMEASGKIAVVSPYVDTKTGKVMLSICKLLNDHKSVVSLDVSLDDTQALVEQTAGKSNWTSVMVLDGEGFVVAHSDRNEIGKKYLSGSSTGLGHLVAEQLKKVKGRSFEVRQYGNTYEVFFAPLWEKWYVVSVIEAGACFSSLNRLYILFFFSLAMIFGFISGVYIYMSRSRQREIELNTKIKAIAGIYVSVHLIDIKQDTFSEVAVNADFMRVMLDRCQEHAQSSMRMVMDSLTDQRYKKGIYSFIDFSTLEERVRGKQSITKEFISAANRRCKGRFIPVEWDEDGTLRSVLWMVEITDERSE